MARDAARQASIHLIDNTPDLIAFAESRGTFGGDRPTATHPDANVDENTHIDGQNGTVTVVLRVPMADVGIFGILNIGGRAISVGNSDNNLVAFVKMRLEPE